MSTQNQDQSPDVDEDTEPVSTDTSMPAYYVEADDAERDDDDRPMTGGRAAQEQRQQQE